MKKTPHVGILIDQNSTFGRGVMLGIARYGRSHQRWQFFAHSVPAFAPLPEDLRGWSGDGLIAQVVNPTRVSELQAKQIPVVNVSGSLPECPLPTVRSDHETLCRMVVEHLAARGLRTLGYCGYAAHPLSQVRGDAFRRAAEKIGLDCHTYEPDEQVHDWTFESVGRDIAKWLGSLPRPIGIMTMNDIRARHVADICHTLGLRIPEDIAIVGVDDDILLCELANPPLSSVDIQGERIGFEAARLLTRLMAGKQPPAKHILIPPAGVVQRHSSDRVATEDVTVARALRFIRENIGGPINVGAVAEASRVSRRLLERKFRQHLDTTIGREIILARLERVKQLLRETDSSMPDIAATSGYYYVQQLNQSFKHHFGMSPTAYRRQHRLR